MPTTISGIHPLQKNFDVCWIQLNSGYVYIGQVIHHEISGNCAEILLNPQVEVLISEDDEEGLRPLGDKRRFTHRFAIERVLSDNDQEFSFQSDTNDIVKLSVGDEKIKKTLRRAISE